MKAVYDKLLFVLALLILAGSVAYFLFVAQADTAEVRGDKILSSPLKGGAYAAIDAPQFERKEVPWPAPDAQDEDGNWLFDVFTPPRIYWDRVAGKFVSEPWQPPEQAPPFALELISINQELFRIQMEAYFTDASGNPDDAILQFVDTETDTSFRGKVGSVFENHRVKVDGFKVERQFNSDGTVLMVGTVDITDLISGEKFTLHTSQKLYIPGSIEIHLRTTAPLPVETFIWKNAGDKHVVGETTFVLNAYDMDAQTVTVTKTAPQLEQAEEAVLNAVGAPKPQETVEEAVEVEQENAPRPEGTLDAVFN